MSWIDDFKGQGPWTFVEQADKWGYLNNPRWQDAPTAEVNFSKEHKAREPQIWTPEERGAYSDGGSVEHNPCGHWHKGAEPRVMDLTGQGFTQISLDVHHGRIAVTGMLTNTPNGGFVVLEYFGGQWYALGAVADTSQYLEPNCLRISSESGYIAYFSALYAWDGWTGYMGCWRFDRGDMPRRVTAWESNDNGHPYRCGDYHIHNVMDCYGDRLACAGYITHVAGAAYDKYQIKMSHDGCRTFDQTFEFPTGLSPYIGSPYYFDQVYIRMDQTGTAWACYLRTCLGSTKVELWKSDSGLTTFSKIWEIDYSADFNGKYPVYCSFDIEDATATQMHIRMTAVDGANLRQLIYYSSDSGVNFTAYTDLYPTADLNYPFYRGVGNGPIIVHSNKAGDFYRSLNGGDTWSSAVCSADPNGTYIDHQKHHAEQVYGECSDPFDSGGYDIAFLYSPDNGTTWETRTIPFHTMGGTAPVLIPYFPGYTEECVYAPAVVGQQPKVQQVIVTNTATQAKSYWVPDEEFFLERDVRWTPLPPGYYPS